MKTILTLFLVIFLAFFGLAQSLIPVLSWQKCYGGSGYEWPKVARLTQDQGIIIAGSTSSSDIDVTTNYGYIDYWLVKTDNKGVMQWQKSYGGSGSDMAYSCQLTSDGGYIIVGNTYSTDGHVTNNHGKSDWWVIKTDSEGNIEWQKTYGGSEDEWAHSVIQTSDGGYAIAGFTDSYDGDVTGKHYGSDAWVVKIDANGTIEWQKCYGGDSNDGVNDIKQTNDGGYILACISNSDNGDLTLNRGYNDIWIVKTDAQGTIQWQKSYGGSMFDEVSSICQTFDGGYVFASDTYSTNGNIVGNHGSYDIWIVKLNPSGDIIWSKCLGGKWEEYASEIHQTSESGYIVAGNSNSNTGNVTANHGEEDFWVVKLQETGTIQWQMSLGGTKKDYGLSVIETSENGYFALGFTSSNDGNVSGLKGEGDNWLLSLCSPDPIYISVSDLPYCYSTTIAAEGSFYEYLWNTGDTTQSIEVNHEEKYSVEATNLAGCKSSAAIDIPSPTGLFNMEKICLATVDEQTGKNLIIVNKSFDVGTDTILFYRKESTENMFRNVGSIPFNELSAFIDEYSFPGEKSYQYKISTKNNNCERESDLSPAHELILLKAVYNSSDLEVELEWTPYKGLDYSEFQIYRSNAGGDMTLIGNTPSNTYSYSDISPPAGTNAYQIRVWPEVSCTPTKTAYNYSSSNVVNVSTNGIDDNLYGNIQLYPNPVSDILTVKVKAGFINYPFVISDLTGRVLVTGKLTSEIMQIDITDLDAGVYFFKIGDLSNLVFKIIKQ